MASREQLLTALRNADKAGDTEAAKRIAAMLSSAETSTAEPEPEYERNWYDAPRAALQGATMGWSDELGALTGAGIAKGAQFFNDDETDFGDIYDQMKERINQERKEYEEANPGEALALNVAGGLVTGGIGAQKALGTKALQNAGKLKKALALTAVGGTEGAIAGAGSADEGNRGEGAVIGGTIGTILPLALSGGRKVVDTIAKRRVQPEMLDEAGNFLPLNQVLDEGSALGNVYQKIISPSFGGQQLRNQNREVLNRTTKALDEAKQAKTAIKTTGKKADEKVLRDSLKMNSLPHNVSEEFKTKIIQSDGSEAIKNIDQAWNQGFDVVKSKSYNINPNELVEEVMADLDSPMDSEFAGKIGGMIRNKLKGGFTASKADPEVKYQTKGMGSVKAPQVELDSGEVDGKWLMQARNDLRMAANDLADEGASALEVHALKNSARKIDALIRSNLDEAENAIFDKELQNWGNYQAAKGATRKAGTTQQGLYEPQQLLQTLRTNQGRKFDLDQLPFKTQAQDLQVKQKGMIDRADKQIELDEAALREVKGRLPNLNPDPWTKTVSTATMGGAPLALAPLDNATKAASAIPLGYTLGKIGSTQTAQKALGGQTEFQKTLAEMLRNYDGSSIQQGVQAGQGALTREHIMSLLGDEQ